MLYACVAKTRDSARCRRFTRIEDFNFNPDSCRCFQHPNAPTISPPHGILYRFHTNEKWANKLIEAGVQFNESPNFSARDEKHIEQARLLGRQEFNLLQTTPAIPAAGVPVFGPDRKGLQNVMVSASQEPTHNYHITKIFLEPCRENHGMFTFVLAYETGAQTLQISTQLGDQILEFVSTTWRHCHVWANPPRMGDGKIVDAVIFNIRQPKEKPSIRLLLNNGLWAVEPV